MWSGHASPSMISTFISLHSFFMIAITSSLLFCRSLFSRTLARIPHGIRIDNWNVLCVLPHFSSCVKPPCPFVMRLPNRLDCSMEVLFAKAFLPTPGRTRGFVKPEGSNKKIRCINCIGFFIHKICDSTSGLPHRL